MVTMGRRTGTSRLALALTLEVGRTFKQRKHDMKFGSLPLAAGLLALSVGAAAAAPATVEQDLHLRAGRSTQSPVIGVLRGGSTVDARNCGGGWCAIDLRRAPATPAAAISTSRAARPGLRRGAAAVSSVRAITMTGPRLGLGPERRDRLRFRRASRLAPSS